MIATPTDKSSKDGQGTEKEKLFMHTACLRAWSIIWRALSVFGVTVAICCAVCLGMVFILVKGPSSEARRLFVLSVKETSAGGFLAHIFLNDAEVEKILNLGKSETATGKTDAALIEIPEYMDVQSTRDDDVEVISVHYAGSVGKMMIIKNPARVILGIPDRFGSDASGLTLRDMIEKYNAIGGVNAGGFWDPDGMGTGGVPDGLIIEGGKLLWGDRNTVYGVIGLDRDHILHVGKMTAQEALDRNVESAVSFGPSLVINGQKQNRYQALGGGLNPRTAIGQRADGAILLLTMEGRQLGSIGLTYDDLADLMESYGAVNAANLDGGSSTLMIYRGENQITSSYIFGQRSLASAFLVK